MDELNEAELDFSQDLTIANDYMFGRVMRNEKICRGFLHEVLPEIEIGPIRFLDHQKTMDPTVTAHGVRLDIYADDGTIAYNIEIQRENPYNLPKRARYYQSQIDADILDKGEDYDTLRDCYVIFVCTFDPFGEKRYRYTFKNRCSESEALALDDGAIKVFLNTKGQTGEVSDNMKRLLTYFNNRQTGERTELIEAIENEVEIANKDSDWRHEMMTLEMKIRDRERMAARKAAEKAAREAEQKNREQTAIEMLKLGMEVAIIQQVTKLPVSRIEELKESLKNSVA